jgi:predicted  nucleic acid-binding Zn-ribbon protein
MPAVRTSSTSTTRHLDLTDFIDVFGDTMVQKCSNCAKHNTVCKVHLRSGKCNHCNRKNIRCDVKVIQSEFRRLTEEKQKLKRQIDEALSAQAEALEALRTARAREERLRQQMDLTDRRAAEAIAVESRALEELDAEEAQETLVPDTSTGDLALQLSPST